MIHECFISVRKYQEDEIGMLFALYIQSTAGTRDISRIHLCGCIDRAANGKLSCCQSSDGQPRGFTEIRIELDYRKPD